MIFVFINITKKKGHAQSLGISLKAPTKPNMVCFYSRVVHSKKNQLLVCFSPETSYEPRQTHS